MRKLGYTAEIMQGDEYPFDIKLRDKETGEVITGDDIAVLEAMISSTLRYAYPETMTYDEDTQCFTFRPTQEQTFSLKPGVHAYQIRIKTLTGEVNGKWDLPPIKVIDAESQVVL